MFSYIAAEILTSKRESCYNDGGKLTCCTGSGYYKSCYTKGW